jgi:iron complex transport system substrate-binding protein
MALITAILGDSNEIVCADNANLNDTFKKAFPSYAITNPKGLSTSKADDVIASGAQVIFGPVTDATAIAKYKTAGIAIVPLSTFSTTAQLKDNVLKIAAILGGDAPAKAAAFNTYLDTQISYCTKKTGGLGKVKILSLNSAAGVLSTVNSSDILSVYMTTAGGTNVAASATTVSGISTDTVVQWNPDIIITKSAASKAAIMATVAFKDLPAIKNNKVYVIPSGTFLWSLPSAEDALMPLWLAKIMHGDSLGDLDMPATVKNYYSLFFGYAATDAEITAILAGQ